MARICCHPITETKTEKSQTYFVNFISGRIWQIFKKHTAEKQQTFTVLEKNLSVQAFLWASDGNLTAGLGTFAEVQSWQVWNVVVALAADLKSG